MKFKKNIALISSCVIETPPRNLAYGGLEKVVWLQAIALSSLGFDVTVFACEGSELTYVNEYGEYNIVTYCRKSSNVFEELNILKEKYLSILDEFDVIIDHSWLKTIHVHKRFRDKSIGIHHAKYPPEYVIVNPRIYGVSKTHAELIKKLLGVEAGFIYNCVDVWNYEFCEEKDNYVLFLNRWSREKGVLNVLKFAKKYPDVKVVIAGSLFLAEEDVIAEVLKIASNLPNVVLKPEVTHWEKVQLLKKAKATIFMPEPGYCVPPETLVFTPNGFVKIDSVAEGMYVFTHNFKVRKIIKRTERFYSGKLVNIITWNLAIPLKLTPEHKIFAVKGLKCKSIYNQVCKPTYYESCVRNKNCVSFEELQRRLERWRKYEEAISLYKQGASISEISKKLEIPVSTLCYWLHGKAKPKRTDKPLFLHYKPDWIEVSNLSQDDFICIPIPSNEFESKYSWEEMFLFGIYLAEGFVTNDFKQIRFALGKHESGLIEFISDIVDNIYKEDVSIYDCEHTVEIAISNKKLAKQYVSMFGRTSHEKRIPSEFFFLKSKYIIPLLFGLWIGDGTICKSKITGYEEIRVVSTVSPSLAYGTFILLTKLGIVPSLNTSIQSEKSFGKGHLQYYVEVSGENAKILAQMFGIDINTGGKQQYTFIYNNYLFLPIRSVSEISYDGYVYNLIVEEEESYIANGYPVHNCEVFGLWVIESLLCGTPVISIKGHGAIDEIIEDDKHGFLVNNMEEMYEKIKYEVDKLNPKELRKKGEEFEPKKIIEKYLIPEIEKLN